MTYFLDIEHRGLGKFRRIRGSDEFVLQRKAQEQRLAWAKQWSRKQEIKLEQDRRAAIAFGKAARKSLAESQTAEAREEIDSLQQILKRTIGLENASWTSLYDKEKFDIPKPRKPELVQPPIEPKLSDGDFLPRLSFFDKIFPPLKARKLKASLANWTRAHAKWQAENAKAIAENAALAETHSKKLDSWEKKRKVFLEKQRTTNEHIDTLRKRHLDREQEAIKEFTDLILSRSEYPEFFPKQWEIAFDVTTGVMVIDYDLPDFQRIPKKTGVKYVQIRDALEDIHLKDKEADRLYEDIIYQTCLRTIREVFASDLIDAVKSLTFNGYVDFIDRSNGKPSRSCVVSLQTKKQAIDDIDFSAIEPKACFRALKGVGSARLSGMASVVPILQLDRSDDRFVAARDVITGIDSGVNIAAIPWEDFEHLVRDVFEKEFSGPGGEVKITRASRDHGVDAIAFDPDPIRGGKIVIQAKRYTNPVGVSAVRDLYGTLINEGANRGILVTTSVYGPDSYEFAKGKPITLLSGGNLLSLLEKHGHPARIDIGEAKASNAQLDT